MKELYTFQIYDYVSMDTAWEELIGSGVEILYGFEEDGIKGIYGFYEAEKPKPSLPSVSRVSPYSLPPIDWNAQWAMHGLDFRDGYVHVDLKQFGGPERTLRLKPGPGFGDVSHATTKLVLRLMPKYVADASVVDVGCGSGILTLAAAGMGAREVWGLDIDPEALQHAFENAKENGMESKCHFCFPKEFVLGKSKSAVILMNMIMSEQREALKMLPKLDGQNIWIVSGIRESEREEYVNEAEERKWKLVNEIVEEDWMGLVFQQFP